MQSAHQEVARAQWSIAGEDPSRTIGAVGRRRQANEENPRHRITEAGNGASPVGFVTVGGFLFDRDALAVGPKPSAPVAGNDVLPDDGE
jgi:hypothetical protein